MKELTAIVFIKNDNTLDVVYSDTQRETYKDFDDLIKDLSDADELWDTNIQFSPVPVDQYGQPLPKLVEIGVSQASDKVAMAVLRIQWYEAETPEKLKVLLISAKDAEKTGVDWIECEDIGLGTNHPHANPDFSADKIDECLKRWNPISGFYHV